MIGSGILVFAMLQSATKHTATALPIRGLHLSAPGASGIPMFTKFVRDALPREGVNTLVLEIDYRYQFKKHSEIAEKDALTEDQVKEIAKACADSHVRLIPQINLLGHQSWAENTESLLTVHPEFDETRGKFPKNHGKYPNDKDPKAMDFYCRSYCPNAPGLHQVIFDSIDEICDACGADAFHCGMDEVFVLADPDCPNCKGKTAAECFAGEVKALHDHIVSTGRQMWMWGDRFIDGRANGLGDWEASTNGTYDAVGRVPKDIVICDWHYEHAEPTPAFFAMHGFPVVASPWRNSGLAIQQLGIIESIRNGANNKIGPKAQGVLHTTWCGAEAFVQAYYGDSKQSASVQQTVKCFKDLFRAIRDKGLTETK